MTRKERFKLKKKSKRLLIITLSCFAISILGLIIISIVNNNLESSFIVNIVMLIITLTVIAIIDNFRYLSTVSKLNIERNRLYRKKLRMYTEWFFKAMNDGDIDLAIDLNNNFIWDEPQAITRGVLIGYHLNDEKIKDGNIDKLLNQIYDPKKYK